MSKIDGITAFLYNKLMIFFTIDAIINYCHRNDIEYDDSVVEKIIYKDKKWRKMDNTGIGW